MWSALFFICLILSGTSASPVLTGQAMQVLHTFNVTPTSNGLNIVVSPNSLLDFNNFTGMNTSYIFSNQSSAFSNNSELGTLAEGLAVLSTDNSSLTELEGNISRVISSETYTQVGVKNITIGNTTYNSFALQYFLINNESKAIVSTVGLLSNDAHYYSYVMTFLYYSSIYVNLSYWFGDEIILNFTHSLSEHYKYIAEVLQYAVDNIYLNNNTLESQFLTTAYNALIYVCYNIANLIETKYTKYDLPVNQAVILAIDPLTNEEIAEFIFGLIMLFFYTLPISYGLAASGLSIVAHAWFLWKWEVIDLFVTWQEYTAGTASIWNVVWAIAGLVMDIIGYVVEHLGWWEKVLMLAGVSAEYGAGSAAAWLAFVIGITYLLGRLVIDYYD